MGGVNDDEIQYMYACEASYEWCPEYSYTFGLSLYDRRWAVRMGVVDSQLREEHLWATSFFHRGNHGNLGVPLVAVSDGNAPLGLGDHKSGGGVQPAIP